MGTTRSTALSRALPAAPRVRSPMLLSCPSQAYRQHLDRDRTLHPHPYKRLHPQWYQPQPQPHLLLPPFPRRPQPLQFLSPVLPFRLRMELSRRRGGASRGPRKWARPPLRLHLRPDRPSKFLTESCSC
jgi:hypothetical protein